MTVDPIGGVWTYALDLARALEPRGIEIALASMGAQLTRAQRQEVLGRKNIRLFESVYQLEWMDDSWDDVDRAGEWLLGIADRVQPDLIHLNGYSHAVLPWNAPVVVVAHSCVLSWWRAVKDEEAPARYNEYRERVAAGLSAADRVIAPSAAMRDAVALHYGRNVNCTVVPNGRDPQPFLCGEKTSLVFSCGRVWDEAKNLQVLDQIAPHIQWPIAVAGDCRHPNGRAAALNNVPCLGKLVPSELAQQLSRAAIFVLPARYEPFGLSALEAGLSGCALVLGDIASLRETWHGAAIFMPPEDAIGMANAINSLIEDRRRRERFAQQARTRALEFSLHRMTEDYVATYRICSEAVKRRLSGRESEFAPTRSSLLEEVAA
jgi:glycosyltransferase involved in cell wall biosynthesis